MTQGAGAEKLPIAYADEQGRATLSLARLADAFRRAAEEAFEERELAAIFNISALRFAEKLAAFEASGKVDNDIGRALTKIVLLAGDNDIERVILPVGESSKAGEHLRKNVLCGENFSQHYNVSVDFQSEPYVSAPDVEKLGQPREPKIATVFDFGLFR